MSQPHHFVFNELQKAIQKCVPIVPLIPLLLEKKIIKEADLHKFQSKHGMKYLTSFLRNKDFDVFVNFVDCIITAGVRDPSVNLSIVTSIQGAIEGFDRSHGTSYSTQISGLKHQQKQEPESAATTPKQTLLHPLPSASETTEESKSADSRVLQETPSLQSSLYTASVVPASPEMLQLPYVDSIESVTFDANGGKLYSFKSDFEIAIPPGAVPEGRTITVKMGACTHGPFLFPENCYLISGIFCVVADGTFKLPAKVTMQHCMELPEYKRTPQILLLRASENDITETGEYILNPVEYPDVSDMLPHLTFQMKEFCVLCAVFKPHSSRRVERESSSDSTGGLASQLMRQVALDDPSSEGISPQSSVEEQDSPFHASGCTHPSNSKCQRCSSIDSDPSSSPLPSSGENPFLSKYLSTEKLKRKPLKRKQTTADTYTYSRSDSHEKRKCTVKYSLLFFEPKYIAQQQFDVYVYACQDCSVSIEECQKQMREEIPECNYSTMDFKFESDSITFELAENVSHGWEVVAKQTPNLSESDIQIHRKSLEERRRLTELKKYPPRRIFHIMANNPTQPLKCKLFARGASLDPHADAYFTITASLPVPTPHPYPPFHGYPHEWLASLLLSRGHHPYQADASVLLSTESHSTVPPIPSDASPSLKHETVFELKRSMSNEEKDCLYKHVGRHTILKVNEHVKSWKRLARNFGMNEVEISRIDSDHGRDGVRECSYQMLLYWVKTNDSEPTYEKLINALESAHENQALHFVLENLSDLANSN